MSQTVSKDAILNVLEKRYDYQSARNVLDRAANLAGLKGKDSYSSKDIDSLLEELKSFATHSDTAIGEIQGLGGGGGGKPADKAKTSSSASTKVTPAAPVAKDDKPAEKVDDKGKATGKDAKPAEKVTEKKSSSSKKSSRKK